MSNPKLPRKICGWVWTELSFGPPMPDELFQRINEVSHSQARAKNAGNLTAWEILVRNAMILTLTTEGAKASFESLMELMANARKSNNPPRAICDVVRSVEPPGTLSERYKEARTILVNLEVLRLRLRELVGEEKLADVEALLYGAVWISECARELWAHGTGAIDRLSWGSQIEDVRRANGGRNKIQPDDDEVLAIGAAFERLSATWPERRQEGQRQRRQYSDEQFCKDYEGDLCRNDAGDVSPDKLKRRLLKFREYRRQQQAKTAAEHDNVVILRRAPPAAPPKDGDRA